MSEASPDLRLEVEFRVTAEIFDRINRVKKYLNEIIEGESIEYIQLVETIIFALDSIERDLLEALSALLSDLSIIESDDKIDFIDYIHIALRKTGNWFIKIHELLIYLPHKKVMAETILMLKGAFGKQYSKENPSFILGSLFNSLEVDFYNEIVKEKLPDINDIKLRDTKNIVLQLAVCERSSPLTSSILGHELGHAIDLRNGISSRVAEKFLKKSSDSYQEVENWCSEITADLIAAEALGPVPLLSLLSMEYCVFFERSIYLSTKTHPMTYWRLKIVKNFLSNKYNCIDFIIEEFNLYEQALELNLSIFGHNNDEIQQAKNYFDTTFNKLINPIAKEIELEISNIDIPKHHINKHSLQRCVNRIKNGFPVAAQGIARENLREELVDYSEREFKNHKQRIIAFKNLCRKFNETPLDVPVILMAGYMRRLEIIREFTLIKKLPITKNYEKRLINKLCENLTNIDAIIGNSITTSTIHKNLNVIRDSPKKKNKSK